MSQRDEQMVKDAVQAVWAILQRCPWSPPQVYQGDGAAI